VAVNAAALPDGAAADGAAADGAAADGATADALGDADPAEQAAKMTARDAVNTAPFTDHLFGAWDMLPISSYGAPGGLFASLSPAVEHAFVPAGHEGPGAGRRKPSISAVRRHAPRSVLRTPPREVSVPTDAGRRDQGVAGGFRKPPNHVAMRVKRPLLPA
jgi:hypothetical protein